MYTRNHGIWDKLEGIRKLDCPAGAAREVYFLTTLILLRSFPPTVRAQQTPHVRHVRHVLDFLCPRHPPIPSMDESHGGVVGTTGKTRHRFRRWMNKGNDPKQHTTQSPSNVLRDRKPDPVTSTPITAEVTGMPNTEKTTISSKSRRRSEAEKYFADITAELDKVQKAAIGKDTRFVLPQAIVLRNVDEVVDVEPTAIQIESAIDEFTKARKALEPTADGIKGFAIKWFQLSFPFVKSTVEAVKASTRHTSF
jgi:hypothetical protein